LGTNLNVVGKSIAAAIQLHIQGPLGPRIKEISIFSSFCTLAHFLPIYAVLVKFM
jgi:hypothetical protein